MCDLFYQRLRYIAIKDHRMCWKSVHNEPHLMCFIARGNDRSGQRNCREKRTEAEAMIKQNAKLGYLIQVIVFTWPNDCVNWRNWNERLNGTCSLTNGINLICQWENGHCKNFLTKTFFIAVCQNRHTKWKVLHYDWQHLVWLFQSFLE